MMNDLTEKAKASLPKTGSQPDAKDNLKTKLLPEGQAKTAVKIRYKREE